MQFRGTFRISLTLKDGTVSRSVYGHILAPDTTPSLNELKRPFRLRLFTL